MSWRVWVGLAALAFNAHAGKFCLHHPGACAGNEYSLVYQGDASGRNPFHDIDLGSHAAPAVADWDGDEDLDVVVGIKGGQLKYLERLSSDLLVERTGATNPFHDIRLESSPGDNIAPAVVDWDGDGDFDLVVHVSFHGLKYFERLSNNSLVERIGAGSNPFTSIDSLAVTAPAVADWDSDGDLDVVICIDRRLYYYEQRNNILEWRYWAEDNPFRDIPCMSYLSETSFAAAPALVDWDGDGDLDLVVTSPTGQLKYFERLSSGVLVERTGQDNSPFHDMDAVDGGSLDGYAAPAIVDWDGDGDLDVVVGTREGQLKYFELQSSSSLVNRVGASNPFRDHDYLIDPVAVDWDGDGDWDLISQDWKVGVGVAYFEQLSSGVIVERTGAANPFRDIEAVGYAVVDWDGDGDLDMIAQSLDCQLKYIEQLSNNSFVERTGAGSNPFHDIELDPDCYDRPAVVDWDADGDWDLVIGKRSGQLKYFEQLSNDSFVERTGADGNPFHVVDVGGTAAPAVVDWDADGDLDVVVGTAGGQLKYFEQLRNNSGILVERTGADANPFHDIVAGDSISFYPAIVDWDGDGDLDLLVSTDLLDSMGFWSRGFCIDPLPCSNRGACHAVSGQCQCLASYTGDDCSSCSSQFYRASRAFPPQCLPCAGTNTTCSNRGTCWDDPTAASVDTALLAIGNGSCSCTDPAFGGVDAQGRTTCSEGACKPGSEEAVSSDGLLHCKPCEAGKYGLDGKQCEQCDAGSFAAEGSRSCAPCVLFFVSAPGSKSCEFDYVLACLCFGCSVCQFFGWLMLLLRARRLHRITDVSQSGKQLVITTFQAHGMKVRAGHTAKVKIFGTGHPDLDKVSIFQARVLEPCRLELLTAEGEHMCQDIATSMGFVQQVFPREFIDAPVPMLVINAALVLMPWCLLVFAPFWNHLNSDMELTWSYWALAISILTASALSAAAAAFIRMRVVEKRTPLERRHVLFLQRLRATDAKPAPCERGPARAVKIEQIVELLEFFRDFIQMRSAYYLDTNIVRPLTRHQKISYAELAGPSTLDFFVSHYWGTPFAHFVETLRQHAETTSELDWRKLSYWVCFLSNNQWKVKDEVGNGDWRESSFYKALSSGFCKATCMVLDSKALPLTRSWCLFEVLQTFRLLSEQNGGGDFQGLLFCTSDGVIGGSLHGCYDVSIALAERLAKLSVKDAKASNPEDQESIMNLVQSEGGPARIDNFIRDSMQRTLLQVQSRFTRDMQMLLQGQLGSSQQEVPPEFQGQRGSSQENAATACQLGSSQQESPPVLEGQRGNTQENVVSACAWSHSTAGPDGYDIGSTNSLGSRSSGGNGNTSDSEGH